MLVYIAQSQTGNFSGSLFFWKNPEFRSWQLITHMFMHGSTNHLLFNMLGLWMFGSVLEKVWGAKHFLVFYLLCGIGAALISIGVKNYQLVQLAPELSGNSMALIDALRNYEWHLLENLPEKTTAIRLFETQMVGASGAIYGILVAFALLFPNHKLMLIFLPVPIAAKYFVPALLGLDLFSGVTGVSLFGGNIAHFAHIGGAVIGASLTYIWLQQIKRKQQQINTQMGMWRE